MKILTAISFALAVMVSCLFLVVPTYSTHSTYSTLSGESRSVGHATLLQVNGPGALMALVVPVLIALVPVLIPKCGARIISGLILIAFAVIAGFSIGLFYFPSAVTMLLSGLLSASVRNR